MKVICRYCEAMLREKPASGYEEPLLRGVCENCLPRLAKDIGRPADEFVAGLTDPVLVVSGDGMVVAGNAAARELLGKNIEEVVGIPGGAAIGCVHARESGGCEETDHCADCAIRQSVRHTAATGEDCTRVTAYSYIGLVTGNKQLRFLISTRKAGDFVLLSVDEIGTVD